MPQASLYMVEMIHHQNSLQTRLCSWGLHQALMSWIYRYQILIVDKHKEHANKSR